MDPLDRALRIACIVLFVLAVSMFATAVLTVGRPS